MANLKDLKTQIENANALGVANLTEKGVEISADATTYEIMGKIAEITAESNTRDEIACDKAGTLVSTGYGTKTNDGLALFGLIEISNYGGGMKRDFVVGVSQDALKTSGITAGALKSGSVEYKGQTWYWRTCSVLNDNYTTGGEVTPWEIGSYNSNDISGDIAIKLLDYYYRVNEIEVMIDNSGVLDSTEGTVNEKVEQLIDKAELENAMYMLSVGLERLQINYETDIEVFPRLNLKKCKYFSAQYMKKLKRIDYYLNTENLVNSNSVFKGCEALEYIKGINTSKVSGNNSAMNMFYACRSLKTIEEPLDFSLVSILNNPFGLCEALENVCFVPESLKCTFTISYSSKLSAESIQSIIDGLATVETAQTLTLNSAITLTDEQKATINAKGWTLAQ